MRIIQASEAKTKLLSLLDDVEKGETLVITRHGRPIARLVPDEADQQRQRDDAFRAIGELRKRTKPMSIEEILSARHEGHKF